MKKFFTGLFLVCILVLGFTNISSAANWQWITSTDTATVSFDTTSIKNNSTNNSNPAYSQLVYSAWIKWTYVDSEGEKMAEKFNFKKPIAYSLVEEHFDYKNKGILIKFFYYYDNEGKVLFGSPTYETTFQPVIPDSIGEVIYNTTLKEFNAQRNGQSGKSWKDYLK